MSVPVSVFLIDRPSHAEQPGQDVNEDSPHPRCHGVSLRAPKMNIENHNRHTNAGRILIYKSIQRTIKKKG